MIKGQFAANTLILTLVSAALQLIGLAFQIYLTNRIGAGVTGLFFLVMSVGSFAATFAISGARFAGARLVSEELGLENGRGALSAVYKCFLYSSAFGAASMLLLYFGAEFIGGRLIGDVRCVLSLKVLAFGMPFFSMGAVLYGYLTARKSAVKLAAIQFFEQAVRIAATLAALSAVNPGDAEKACAAGILGFTASEAAGFFISLAMFLPERRLLSRSGRKEAGMWGRILGIAPPLALSAYMRTALSAVCNIMIPRALRVYGAGAEGALASYGTIQGMAMPVVAFPMALFASIAEMLVPELTDAQVKRQTQRIRKFVSALLRLCLLISAALMCVLFCFSGAFGRIFYGSAEAGRYIRAFSLLAPLLYLDAVTDGMLRGLGEQLYAMRVNVADSLLSLVLISVLLPRFGTAGYIAVMYFTEIFNFSLSFYRLSKTVFREKRQSAALAIENGKP